MTFCGKIRYSDPDDAREYMRYLKSKGILRKHSTVYFCDPCQAYHFGRIPKDAYQALMAIQLLTRERQKYPTIDDVMIATGLSYTKTQRAMLVLKAYGWLRPEFEDWLVLSDKHTSPKETLWMEKL